MTETDVNDWPMCWIVKEHTQLKTVKVQKWSTLWEKHICLKNGKKSNMSNDNECDDCKRDCKIVTIRTRFGFWYKEKVDSSVELKAELRLEPEDQVVVVAGGGRQVSAECGL